MGCVGFVTYQLWWIQGKGLCGLVVGGGGGQGLDERGPHFLRDLKFATDQSTH